MINAALLGNPNCGKTTLFNALTGSTAYTGNWPGVTVEKREGVYKNKKRGSEEIKITDLPGIYSLSPYSPEEVISRNFILHEKPDVVISVIDATNLERNLYMTTQLLEMDVPVVVALNMIDAVAENDQRIDTRELEKALGVKVVSISALRNKGLDELMEAVSKTKERKGISFLPFKETLEKAKKIYEDNHIDSPLFHAVKALEKDELEEKENKVAYNEVNDLVKEDKVDYESSIADERYKFLSPLVNKVIEGKKTRNESEKLTLSDKIDKVMTNKWAALPIMIVILFAIFHIVFAGDLFYMHAMGLDLGEGYLGYIKFNIGGEEVRPFAGLFYDDAGIAPIGEFLHRLAGDQETGILGCIALGIKQGLISAGASEWVIGLIYDGVLGGVCAVLGFVPQIMLLFAFFSLLEDSGYMARIAFVLDRLLRRFGVSGRAFLPMIMGFGCGVPAMMNTRTLSSDQERTKTIRVIPFFTCGAKAEFLVIIAAAIAAAGGLDAGLFTFMLYLLGVVIALVSVIVMTKTSQREKVPPFIMELPAYHLPSPKALALHVYDKGKHFAIKAFTIIFLSTVIIWVLSNFSWKWEMVEPNESILHDLGVFIAPIFTPLGFGSAQTGGYSWIFSVASIQGIVAKENVTSTVESLASGLGLSSFEDIAAASGITKGGLVGFALLNMLTIPCFASVATAKGELKDHKTFVFTVLFWLGLSYIMGIIGYISVDYVWTLGITLPLLVLGGVGLYFYDRYKTKKEAMAA
ncbi:MAG: ferrous iron transporter B [Mollicutes bacterium]|nr:ferrous iron transporter B [Mollicutes bacterium]